MAAPTPAKREARAKHHLKLMLHAANAVLVAANTADHANYEAEVRAAAARTRKYLDAGATAYDALIGGFVPLFLVSSGKEVER